MFFFKNNKIVVSACFKDDNHPHFVDFSILTDHWSCTLYRKLGQIFYSSNKKKNYMSLVLIPLVGVAHSLHAFPQTDYAIIRDELKRLDEPVIGTAECDYLCLESSRTDWFIIVFEIAQIISLQQVSPYDANGRWKFESVWSPSWGYQIHTNNLYVVRSIFPLKDTKAVTIATKCVQDSVSPYISTLNF